MSVVSKVTIRLVDPVSSKELNKKNFQLVDGRLRVQQILDYFQIKHIEWKEADVVLAVREDGLSDTVFKGGEIISTPCEEIKDGAVVLTQSVSLDSGSPLKARVEEEEKEKEREREKEKAKSDGEEEEEATLTRNKRATTLPYPPPSPNGRIGRSTSSPVLPRLELSSKPELSLNLKAISPHKTSPAGKHAFRSRDSSIFVTNSLKTPEPLTHDDAFHEFDFKLIIVGEANCGKTSLIRRYVDGRYSRFYKATIGVDFSSKEFIVSEKLNVRLQLWDVAGQERFGTFTRVYYKDAVGGAVVFDLTNPKTLELAARWKADIDDKVYLENGMPIPVVLVGNKSDLMKETSLQQTPESLDQFCAKHNFAAWFITSCVEDHNIQQVFKYLGNRVLENDLKFPALKEEEKKAIKLNMKITSGDENQRKCCGRG